MADGMPGQQHGKRRVSLVFFDAGGGHRNAATALQVQIERQGLPFEISLVNLQEVLESKICTTRCSATAGRWGARN